MALMEVVMVVDGLSRAAKPFIAGSRYFVGWGITVSTPSCIVVTLE